MHTVSVSHHFETGHRLPHLPGKCQSLHGHSWRVELTVAAPATKPDGTIVMFGDLKANLRSWVDQYLDHGVMLGGDDVLTRKQWASELGKVFVFDSPEFGISRTAPAGYDAIVDGLYWPSVESVAELLGRVANFFLPHCGPAEGAYVSCVRVSETPTNTATWEPGRRLSVGSAVVDLEAETA